MAKGLDDLQAEYDAAQAVVGALTEGRQVELIEGVLDGDDRMTWDTQAAYWTALDTVDVHRGQLVRVRCRA